MAKFLWRDECKVSRPERREREFPCNKIVLYGLPGRHADYAVQDLRPVRGSFPYPVQGRFYPEVRKKFDASTALFTGARHKGHQTTEKFAEFVDHASDIGVLNRAELFLVRGLELVERTIENVVNFHHGREYTRPVAGEKICRECPQFS